MAAETFLVITGAQIFAARKLLGWEREKLAWRSGLLVTVIKRAELSPGVPVITVAQRDALLRALEAAGIVFMLDEPGVKLGKEGQP